jgi:hypothetical protein
MQTIAVRPPKEPHLAAPPAFSAANTLFFLIQLPSRQALRQANRPPTLQHQVQVATI